MLIWMKPLLIWLLVLALPAQAVAAASMTVCGPAHSAGAAGLATPAQPVSGQIHPCGPSHSLQQHAQHQAQSGHEPAARAGDDSVVTSLDDAADSSPATPSGTHKCSACASCCSGGAMLNAMPQWLLPGTGATAFVAVVQAIEAVAAGGPDRPPRSLIA